MGAIIFYYLATDEQIIEKSQKNLITIKEAESDAAKIITIPLNVETSSSISTNNDKVKKPEILENLDEVLQIQQKLR
ncbi:MAG: hypothetical protein FXV79_03970 [Candidatus Thioglobus sp.]|nr:MAG: hypothetical protein FXV79_03970 [Candidatus Thioglobus sp.]